MILLEILRSGSVDLGIGDVGGFRRTHGELGLSSAPNIMLIHYQPELTRNGASGAAGYEIRSATDAGPSGWYAINVPVQCQYNY